jgi:hypothetical protein
VVIFVVVAVAVAVPMVRVICADMGVWIGMGILPVAVAMGASHAIGTAFGGKRFDTVVQRTAEPAQHVLQHFVAADQQAPPFDLHRQVAVAQMPRKSRQMQRIIGAHFGQRLRRWDDRNLAAVFQHQRHPSTQFSRLRQVEQEFDPAVRHHPRAPSPAVVIGQGRGVDGIGRSSDGAGVDHDFALRLGQMVGSEGVMRRNIDPVDEFLYISQEINRLKARREALRAEFVAKGIGVFDGPHGVVTVTRRRSVRVDPAKLPEAIRHDPRYLTEREIDYVVAKPHVPDPHGPEEDVIDEG